MKIILSPAKKMITDTDSITPVGMPDFLDKTAEIQEFNRLSYRFREDLSSEKEYIFERLSAL